MPASTSDALFARQNDVPYQRVNLLFPPRPGEHTVVPDTGLHVVALAVGPQTRTQVVRRRGLADGAYVVALAFDREQGCAADRPRFDRLALKFHRAGRKLMLLKHPLHGFEIELRAQGGSWIPASLARARLVPTNSETVGAQYHCLRQSVRDQHSQEVSWESKRPIAGTFLPESEHYTCLPCPFSRLGSKRASRLRGVRRRTERLHQPVGPRKHCDRMSKVKDFKIGEALCAQGCRISSGDRGGVASKFR